MDNFTKVTCWFWEQGCQVAIDWPAWVQAVGSIAAIYYAYIVSKRQTEAQYKTAMDQVRNQHENDIRLRKEDEKKRHNLLINALKYRSNHFLTVLGNLIIFARENVSEIPVFNEKEASYYRLAFQDYHDDLLNLNVYELPSTELIQVHVQMRVLNRQVQVTLDRLTKVPPTNGINSSVELVKNLERLDIFIKALLVRLDAELTLLQNPNT